MRIIERILLAIYALLVMVLSIFAIALSLRLIPSERIIMYIKHIYTDTQSAIIMLVVALLFIIVSLDLLLSGTRRKPQQGAILKQDDMGSAILSVNAIDSMVQRSSRTIEGVKDIKSIVQIKEDGVHIALNVQVEQDANIPVLIDNLQNKVKEYLESYGGVKVKDISVHIDSIFPATKYKAV